MTLILISFTVHFILTVPDFPLCLLGVLKHRASLARWGGHLPVYRVYLLQGPSKGPHNVTSTWPLLSYIPNCILIKPVLSNHLSYVTLFQYSLGRSHQTGLTVIGDNRKHEHNHDYLPLVNVNCRYNINIALFRVKQLIN